MTAPVTPMLLSICSQKEPSICSDSVLSDFMPDIAMATSSLNQMGLHDCEALPSAQFDLELDLGDGNNHSTPGTLYIWRSLVVTLLCLCIYYYLGKILTSAHGCFHKLRHSMGFKETLNNAACPKTAKEEMNGRNRWNKMVGCKTVIT